MMLPPWRPAALRLTNMVIRGTIDRVKVKSTVVNVAVAKAQLPELIERAANGEVVILARAGKPRAKIVQLDAKPSKLRVPGKGKGRFRVKKGFDEPLSDDELALFEGSS